MQDHCAINTHIFYFYLQITQLIDILRVVERYLLFDIIEKIKTSPIVL